MIVVAKDNSENMTLKLGKCEKTRTNKNILTTNRLRYLSLTIFFYRCGI